MKAFIARSGRVDTWIKAEYFCPHCASQSVWVSEDELLGRSNEQYICLECAWMFAMPVRGEITEREPERFTVLVELREAIKFPRKVFSAELK